MSLRPFRIAILPLTMLMLTGFRMPVNGDVSEHMLYDIRGAFVTAQPDVSRDLITRTDLLIDTAIQATTRSIILPRTILTVRIGEARPSPVLFGYRYSARVTVKAVSVTSGEPVAEGSFEATSFAFAEQGAADSLAEKIASQIASEFRLTNPHRATTITAYAESVRR
ncbi:hypothetical protein [Aliirhizobium smilacinae]|uniref:Uncharacterized protein n=1 Tax=Aliirhizobium smilacinae TaxID=1395944 RepID=A0A5C4XFJ7_9HYPH|nr:hypothetical protein [Rhizobium smilacinae]TNM62132.1 hypothetical protein FHP24_18745 [Rhizobium smilacinae]